MLRIGTPSPPLDMKLGKVFAQTLVEPVLDEFVEQRELLEVENDASRTAVMESYELVAFERGSDHY